MIVAVQVEGGEKVPLEAGSQAISISRKGIRHVPAAFLSVCKPDIRCGYVGLYMIRAPISRFAELMYQLGQVKERGEGAPQYAKLWVDKPVCAATVAATASIAQRSRSSLPPLTHVEGAATRRRAVAAAACRIRK
eukprot:SAG11_NODE_991_length_6262_cov_12.112607_3_plen_135_part_00